MKTKYVKPTVEEVQSELKKLREPAQPGAPGNKMESKYKIGPARLQLAEYKHSVHFATVDSDTPYEALFDTTGQFWSSYAKDLRVNDLIRVMPDNRNWFAELLVATCNGANAATVVELWKKDLPNISQKSSDGLFRIEYMGPHLEWCVIRNSDNSRVKERLKTDGEAMEWVALNRRAA